MNKELSTKLFKLNFREIIDNATNKVYWTKKWKIFEYDGILIEFSLDSINITHNKLYGKLKLCGDRDSINLWSPYSLDRIITIPLQEEHYNKLALNKELCGKVDELFLNLGCAELRLTDEYDELNALEEELRKTLEEIAENFLDNENVSNHEIRDVYIDNYIDNNMKDYTTVYINENKYGQFVEHRATFCYVMGYDSKAENIVNQSGRVDVDWIFEEAKVLREQLDNDDMEEYEDNLESI